MKTFSVFYKNKIKIFFIFALFYTPFIHTQPLNEKLNTYLTNYYEIKDIPSISAGAAKNGKIIWLGTKGYADVENQVPAEQNTLYRIASISKSLTAVAVMQLVEQNKIKLDDDARKYIPYFPKKKWVFTVRQLLNHTSGIRNYKPGEFDSKIFYPTTKEAVQVLIKDSLDFKPGTKYSYTTLGYNILAAIIENVSKLSFTDYMQKYIFEPAGMANTFPGNQKEILAHRAHGYEKNDYRRLINAPLADLSSKYAGGGFLSTAEDLLKFGLNLLEGKLIKKATLDTMLMPVRLTDGTYRNVGLGLEFGVDNSGRNHFGHLGGGTGFSSLFVIYPYDSVVTVDLINTRDRNLEQPAFDFASIIIGKNFIPPHKSLADELLNITLKSGLDSALTVYKNIRTDSSTVYSLNNGEIKLLGYDLIRIKHTAEAIKFYKFILMEKPNEPEMFTGLADAYYEDGNKGLALKNFRIALKLDPQNNYVKSMIKILNGG